MFEPTAGVALMWYIMEFLHFTHITQEYIQFSDHIMGWTVWGSICNRGKRMHRHTLQSNQLSIQLVLGFFPQGQSSWTVQVTSHVHLELRLRLNGVKPLLPHMLPWHKKGQLYIYLYCCSFRTWTSLFTPGNFVYKSYFWKDWESYQTKTKSGF